MAILKHLDGPFTTREEAWKLCQKYAAILKARGLAPEWTVGIRVIDPEAYVIVLSEFDLADALESIPETQGE
jgi:hypothetical protein